MHSRSSLKKKNMNVEENYFAEEDDDEDYITDDEEYDNEEEDEEEEDDDDEEEEYHLSKREQRAAAEAATAALAASMMMAPLSSLHSSTGPLPSTFQSSSSSSSSSFAEPSSSLSLEGMVTVPISSLRLMHTNSSELIAELANIKNERDSLISKNEILSQRLFTTQEALDRTESLLRAETARQESLLRGKDETIHLLATQLSGTQGQLVQTAYNSGLASGSNSATTAAAVAAAVKDTTRSKSPYESGSGISEEDFVLMSEENSELQNEVASLRAQVQSLQQFSSAKKDGDGRGSFTSGSDTISNTTSHTTQNQNQQSYLPQQSSNQFLESSTNAFAHQELATSSSSSSSSTSMGPSLIRRGRGNASYDDLANENTRLKQQLVAEQEETGVLRASHSSADARIQAAETLSRSLQDEQVKLRSHIERITSAAIDTEKELKRTSAAVLAAESDCERMRKRAINAEEKNDGLLQSLEQAQTALRESQAELGRQRSTLQQQSSTLDNLREAAVQRTNELHAITRELETTRAEQIVLRSQLQAATTAGAASVRDNYSTRQENTHTIYERGGGGKGGREHHDRIENHSQKNTYDTDPSSNMSYRQSSMQSQYPLKTSTQGQQQQSSSQQSSRVIQESMDHAAYESTATRNSTSVAASPPPLPLQSRYQQQRQSFGGYDGERGSGSSLPLSQPQPQHVPTIPQPSSPTRRGAIPPASTANILSHNYSNIQASPRTRKSSTSSSTTTIPMLPTASNMHYNDNETSLAAVSVGTGASISTGSFKPRESLSGRSDGEGGGKGGQRSIIPPPPLPSSLPPFHSQHSQPESSYPQQYNTQSTSTSVGPAPAPAQSIGIAAEKARRLAMLADIASGSTGAPSVIPLVATNPSSSYYSSNPTQLSLNSNTNWGNTSSVTSSQQQQQQQQQQVPSFSLSEQQYTTTAAAPPSPTVGPYGPPILLPPPVRRGGRALVPGSNTNATSSSTIANSYIPPSSSSSLSGSNFNSIPPPLQVSTYDPTPYGGSVGVVNTGSGGSGSLSRYEAASQAQDREAAAPFATEASVASMEAMIAEKESSLLEANQMRASIDSELKTIASGPRTIASMRRKEELELARERGEKTLSELRRWLKANAD